MCARSILYQSSARPGLRRHRKLSAARSAAGTRSQSNLWYRGEQRGRVDFPSGGVCWMRLRVEAASRTWPYRCPRANLRGDRAPAPSGGMRSVDDDHMLRDPRLIDVIDEHPDPVLAGSSASRRQPLARLSDGETLEASQAATVLTIPNHGPGARRSAAGGYGSRVAIGTGARSTGSTLLPVRRSAAMKSRPIPRTSPSAMRADRSRSRARAHAGEPVRHRRRSPPARR
jgi:hypothetical protein